MNRFSVSHLSDGVLLRNLATLVSQERATTAALLAHLAEVDERKLYLPAAYPSMFAYCVGELRFSEDAAYKRINAARTGRQFPAIFPALAEGRLHLTSVLMMASHLTPENAGELLAAAAHKTKTELELQLAQRFPRPELPERVQALGPAPTLGPVDQLAPERVEQPQTELAPERVEASAPRPKVTPLSPERFAIQFTIGQRAYEKLRNAQALLGHQVPAGEIATVFERALDALVGQLEKSKFAATSRPRHSRRGTAARHIPAAVKRATTSVRLAAECTFGTCFMHHKREARRAQARARAAGDQRAPGRVEAAAAEQSKDGDVVPWLQKLGCRAGEARRAATICDTIPEAPLEERLRLALSQLMPPHRIVPATAT